MYRALIVCNHRYQARDPGLPPLRGPEADGEMLGRALVDPGTGLFSSSHVKLLPDASASEIQEAAGTFFGMAQPDDVLLFYFSGHGRKRNGKLYLCADNTRSGHLLPATAVSNDTLNDIIYGSKARAKILILDCCYSGAWTVKGDEPTELLLWAEGRYVLMATSPVEPAPDAIEAGQPSPFTRVLVEGLLSGARDTTGKGHIDLRDIYRYLVETVGHGIRPRQKYDGFGEIAIARRPATPVAAPPEPPRADPRLSFLDVTLDATDISAHRVAEFRRQLRPDIAEQMPALLSAREFLQRAHLMRDGRLTRAGALLFGEDPALVARTAQVQCTWFEGTARDSLLKEKFDLLGSVPEQIVGAYDFVARVAKRGEAPTADSVVAQAVYAYPMLAVREIIANALVHRDYGEEQVCVHVRIFADRVEVASPGGWTGRQISDGRTTQLGDLRSESRRRNFTLAKVLSWMRMVEGEGAGIPRAVGDCESVGAPQPTMVQQNGVVMVTLYPRDERAAGVTDPAVRQREIARLAGEFLTLGAMADASLRERVVAALPTEIRVVVPRHSQTRPDVASIVAAAYDVPGGLRELLDAARDLEGNTRQARRIGELIDSIAGSGSGSRIIPVEAKTRLLRAAEEVGLWRNPSLRQMLVSELRHELGAAFDPARWSEASADTWSIVSACVQMRRMDTLIAVLQLLVGETPALGRLESLVGEIFSRTTTAAEHSRLDQLLRPVSGDELARILSHPALAEIADDSANAFEIYEVLVAEPARHEALMLFLEVAAHMLDPEPGRELHAVLDDLAGRWDLTSHLPTHEAFAGARPAVVATVASGAPLFYLSYARGDDERLVERFYLDLCTEIRDRMGLPAHAEVGHLDVRDIQAGATWSNQVFSAIARCRVFVALTSPRYFLSETCGREWSMFRMRAGDRAALKPLVWLPVQPDRLPPAAASLVHGGPSVGVRQLMRLNAMRDQYVEFVYDFAQDIVNTAERARVAPGPSLLDFHNIHSAFGPGTDPAPTQPLLVHFIAVPDGAEAEGHLTVAQRVAAEAGFASTVGHVGSLDEVSRRAAACHQIIVLVVTESYHDIERLLRADDGAVTAVLLLGRREPADRVAFGRLAEHESLFRAHIANGAALQLELPSVLEAARNRIFAAGAVNRAPQTPPRPRLVLDLDDGSPA